MTENKRFYCKKDGNQWTVSDRLNQYPMPITSLEFCSVVANALNGLWEKTVRFEKYNQDYMKENEQLKQSVNNLKDTIIKITIAYQRKYDRTIVKLVNEVHDEDITDVIKELQE